MNLEVLSRFHETKWVSEKHQCIRWMEIKVACLPPGNSTNSGKANWIPLVSERKRSRKLSEQRWKKTHTHTRRLTFFSFRLKLPPELNFTVVWLSSHTDCGFSIFSPLNLFLLNSPLIAFRINWRGRGFSRNPWKTANNWELGKSISISNYK